MSLDFYQDETQQALDRLPSTPTGAIEAPFFQSFLPGGLKVMAGEMAKVGRAVSMAAGVVPVAADALANALPWLPGADMRESPTELQDRFFRQHDEVFGSAVKYWTPQPGEVGMAGEIVGSLAGMLPTIIANPALAVGSQVMSQAEDLVDKGVSTTKAVGVGVAQGAGLATGIWMPILGQNLWQRVVIGGAGFNAVQGVTTRAVSQAILGDDKAAELYPTLGLKELTLDLLLGMAFGGVAHISPQMRAQGKDAWARIATWAQDLTPAQVDAIAALRQAEHLNVETAPGTLKTPEDVEANVNRAKAALEQVLRDEPVQVEQMPAPRVEPDTARQVDAETRVAEMMADAERVRTEEGIPELLAAEPERPDMPALWGEIARLAPEEQPGAIGAAIERRLAELGVQANEAAANGAIWRSFFDTASKKYGVRAAELMQQYGIDVQRMQARSPGADAALAGAAESGYGGGRGRLEQPPGNRPQPQDLRATVAGGGPEQGWIGATRIRRGRGGEPLPVYRGSELALAPEHFEPGALGVASGNPSSGLGVWFTTTRSEAGTFGKVQEAYLDLRNPKLVKVEDLPGFESTEAAHAYREQLRAQGYDGMVVTAQHLGGKTHVVAFDAKQVIPIGGHGEYAQGVKPGPMFYSELARQIQSAKMEQAPAKGWKDYIRGLAQKGVKADEVKWSGIEEWLDLQQGKVTRQQVSDFLEKNGVRVEEVELGVDRDALYQDAKDEAARFGITGDLFSKFWGKRSNWRAEQPGEQYPYPDNDVGRKLRDLIEPIIAQRGEQTKYGQYQLPGAKPGSYRELLLTLPAREQDGLPKGYSIQPMARPHWESGVLQGEVGARFALVGPDGVGQRLDAVTEGEARAEAVRRLERQWGAAGTRPESFQSSHFDQPNILAHVRFNERTDADGKRVLFVEEIQSDWAAKARRDGFRGEIPPDHTIKQDGEMWRIYNAEGQNVYFGATRNEAIAQANKFRSAPAAPFVGKTEAWVGLVMKRMIRYASEHGFDRVAWTRGEQQVERYTGALRRAVDQIEWTKTPEGVQLVGYKGGTDATQPNLVRARQAATEALARHDNLGFDTAAEARHAVLDHRDWNVRWEVDSQTDRDTIDRWQMLERNRLPRTKVVDTTEKETSLSDAIGKAMAERILKDPNQSGTIEGEGIKIDDTGMAGFYDRIVPSVAKDLLKKLGGGKVQEVYFDGARFTVEQDSNGKTWGYVDEAGGGESGFATRAEAEAAANRDNSSEGAGNVVGKQQGFDITPAMREKAMGGQTYFQRAPDTNSPAFKRWSNDAPLVTSAEADTHQFKTGEKIVVEAFHGTKRPDRVGEKFLKKRATSGPMAFHTSSPELASRYAESKQDTSLAYEETGYENWFKYKPKGARSTVDIARAWYSLTPEQKLVIAERAPTLRESEDGKVVSLEGNTSGNGSYDHNLKETQRGFDRQGNPLKALVEDWLNSGVLFDREELFLDVLKQAGFPVKEVSFDSPHASHPFVYKNYIAMQKPLVTSDIPQDVRDALVRAAKYDRSRPAAGGGDMWDKNTRTLREWVAEFEKQDAPYVWTSIPDKVTVVLKSLGYDGIVDWSGKGGGDVHPVYIPFDETQVKSAIGNKGTFGDTNNILKQSSARGQINFDDGSTIISLFEGANASTFAHETGHLFLQITRDLAARTDAPSAAVADWATLEGWLGIKDGDIPVAAHEQFARGWEKYLAEGVAPTPELKGIFQQFRDWLLQVYRTLTELDVNLNDEIRGVMDRMLASEAADPTVKAQRATENLEADLGDSWYQRPTIGEDSVTMWHVTSKDLAESIVREGFKPGKVVGPWQGFAPMHKGTYGWSSKARAVFEVQRAAEVSGSVADLAILEIEVPKDAWGNLRPDEDVGRDATWQHSYMEGTVAFEGAVPPQYVKRIIEHGAAPTGGATTEAEGAPAPTGRAVPPPPRGEAGEARATPEAQDEPDPWLQVGRENAPAAEPAPARGLEDQEVRDILLVMAEHEAGWAEIGGRHLGGELGQPNFSAWVPRADWWPKREGKLNEAQTKEAVRKALAGEKLKKKEQLAIDYMVKIAGARANDVQAVGKDEWELTAAEVADAGLEPSTRNVVDAALLARANEISEGAVERLAVMFENDDAGFMAAVRRLIDENHQQGRRIRADLEAARRGQETGGQAPGPAGAEPQGPAVAGAGEPAAGSGAGQRPAAEPQGPAGANAAVDPLRQAVDDIVAADPNRMIVVGRNPDGTPIARTVGEYLDEARMQTELARQDAGLFEIAARCMLGGQ